jgi:hypothetical protein
MRTLALLIVLVVIAASEPAVIVKQIVAFCTVCLF